MQSADSDRKNQQPPPAGHIRIDCGFPGAASKAKLPTSQILTFLTLASFANRDGETYVTARGIAVRFLGIKNKKGGYPDEIEKKIAVKSRSVKRDIKALRANGFLMVTRKGASGRGHSTIHRICSNPFEKSRELNSDNAVTVSNSDNRAPETVTNRNVNSDNRAPETVTGLSPHQFTTALTNNSSNRGADADAAGNVVESQKCRTFLQIAGITEPKRSRLVGLPGIDAQKLTAIRDGMSDSAGIGAMIRAIEQAAADGWPVVAPRKSAAEKREKQIEQQLRDSKAVVAKMFEESPEKPKQNPIADTIPPKPTVPFTKSDMQAARELIAKAKRNDDPGTQTHVIDSAKIAAAFRATHSADYPAIEGAYRDKWPTAHAAFRHRPDDLTIAVRDALESGKLSMPAEAQEVA